MSERNLFILEMAYGWNHFSDNGKHSLELIYRKMDVFLGIVHYTKHLSYDVLTQSMDENVHICCDDPKMVKAFLGYVFST